MDLIHLGWRFPLPTPSVSAPTLTPRSSRLPLRLSPRKRSRL